MKTTLPLLVSAALAVAAPFNALAQQDATTKTAINKPGPKSSIPAMTFARVNGQDISFAEFNRATQEAVRAKYYHAQPPEGEIAALLAETGQSLIDRVLMNDDAKKRKIEPDTTAVDAQVAAYDKQYAGNPAWMQQREQTLPQLRDHLLSKSRLEVLEKQIRQNSASEKDVRGYYEANHDKFTEPEKVKLSVILLKVDPSAGAKAWEATRKEAEKIHKQIKSGTKFEEMAKLRSNDKSAANGGDIGYVHRGMLEDQIHKQIDATPIGTLAEPVVLLEGVMVFRLDGRKLPVLREFSDVRERAKALLERDRADAAWQSYVKKLRATSKPEFSDQAREIMSAAPATK